jgi:hypothetical protein
VNRLPDEGGQAHDDQEGRDADRQHREDLAPVWPGATRAGWSAARERLMPPLAVTGAADS